VKRAEDGWCSSYNNFALGKAIVVACPIQIDDAHGGQEFVTEEDGATEDHLREDGMGLIIGAKPSGKHFRQPRAQPPPQRVEPGKRRPGENRPPDYKGEPEL